MPAPAESPGNADRTLSHPDEIRTQGRVIEVLRDRAYRVELPNGHRCIGRAEKHLSALGEGASVTIAFHPYDLARGWIVGD